MPVGFKRCLRSGLWVSLFILIFGVGVSRSSPAAIIEPDILLLKILEGTQNLFQVYLEIETRVFDPEAFLPLSEDLPEAVAPFELKESGFLQRVVWVRDEVLLMETTDTGNKPLHWYISEPGLPPLASNLGNSRLFSEEDVVFPPLMLMTKSPARLKSYLNALGIRPDAVGIVQYDGTIGYRLGTKNEYLLVDPETFKVLEINREVQIQGRFYPLRISFSNWHRDVPEIPVTTRCFLGSRLFKEIQVLELQKRVVSQRNQFLRLYQDRIAQPDAFSITVDYGR